MMALSTRMASERPWIEHANLAPSDLIQGEWVPREPGSSRML